MSPFRRGDRVQVNMDVSVFRALQDDNHGGWNPEMELVRNISPSPIIHLVD